MKRIFEYIIIVIALAISIVTEVCYLMLYFNLNNIYSIVLIGFVWTLKAYYRFKVLSSYNPYEYKIMWYVILKIFGIFGICNYLIFGHNIKATKNNGKNLSVREDLVNKLEYDKGNGIKAADNIFSIAIVDIMNACCYSNVEYEEIEYLDSGEKYFKRMLEDTKEAKEYIFLEYSIFAKGRLLNELYKLLEEKAKNNVKIYLLIDELTTKKQLDKKKIIKMKKMGINICMYNSNILKLGEYFNYRNHKKMTVIDGKIVYIGGVNIGDEYASYIDKYGYFKDTGIRIKTNSANEFVKMYKNSWNEYANIKMLDSEYIYILKEENAKNRFIMLSNGDTKSSNKNIRDAYIVAINKSKKSINITTPYLSVDLAVINALVLAVKRGVEVNIIIPNIPDKKAIYSITKAYGDLLNRNGINIYKYIKGFIHSKMMIIDDETLFIGSVNMDFKSLYDNNEIVCIILDDKVLSSVNKDMKEDIMKNSKKISEFGSYKINNFIRIFGTVS